MVTAIFPAAGQGKRMGAGKNKVLLDLDGEPILTRTLRRFSSVAAVSELIVIVGAEEIPLVEEILSATPGLKPYKIAAGGSERQYSIANGLKLLAEDAEIVLVHDAARPLIATQTIERVIAATRKNGAAIAAVREKNTVKTVENGFVTGTVPRANLWEVQTPQGFRRELLLKAYAKAEADNFLGTDDASLVERLGAPIAVVESDYKNIKLTTAEDLVLARAFLA